MGVVYKAQDLKLKRIVAIKLLAPELAGEPEATARFIHEAQAASALDHPNICTIYEIDRDRQGQWFIAMACYEGEALEEKIKRGALRLEEALNIALQVAQGLAKAHEREIIHRDIKPANVMITPEGMAKILDFGVAKLAGRTQLSKSGAAPGTVAYMSPEQARGESVDYRTDIWSLGVMLYEMLTGELPFKRLHKNLELERVVSKCLAKKPEERYQSMADLVAGLKIEKKRIESGGKRWRKWLPVLVPAAVGIFILFKFIVVKPQQDSLAVIGFENKFDPEDKDYTAAMLTSLLTTSLSQAGGLEVISPERLNSLREKTAPGETTKVASPALARKVARRAGAKTILLGTVYQTAPRLEVATRLIEVESGKMLGAQRLAGYSADSLFAFVDSLAILVGSGLKFSPDAVADIKPVADVTTSSPEAYRAYIEGTELYNKHLYSDAIAALDQAIELDSNFAMAYWRKFVLVRFFAPTDTTPAVKYLQKALELKERVTERERLNLEAAYALQVEEDCRKAAELCERAIQKYPNERDDDTYSRLLLCYYALGEFDKARQFIMKGLEKDSLDVFFVNLLADHYTVLGRKKEALEYIDRTIRLNPTDAELYAEKAGIYVLDGEIDSALFWWEKALSFRPDFSCAEQVGFVSLLRRNYPAAEGYFRRFASSPRPSPKAKGEAQLTLIPLHQGKFEEARNRLLKLYASTTTPILLKRAQTRTDAVYHLLTLLALESGKPAEALRYAQEVSRKAKKTNPYGGLWARDLLAIAQLKNGNPETAYKLLNEIKRDLDKPGRAQYKRAIPDFTAGFLAYEEGNYPEAVTNFEKGFVRPPMKAPLFHYGVSLLKIGRPDEAIKELERVTWWVPLGNVGSDIDLTFLPTWTFWPVYAVKAHYWLGVAHEQKGDKVKAVQEYEKFLDIWKAADPGIPEMADAKERLAQLKKKG